MKTYFEQLQTKIKNLDKIYYRNIIVNEFKEKVKKIL